MPVAAPPVLPLTDYSRQAQGLAVTREPRVRTLSPDDVQRATAMRARAWLTWRAEYLATLPPVAGPRHRGSAA